MADLTLTWLETDPGRLWRTPDGEYLIMAVELPETPAYRDSPTRIVYHARWVSPMDRAAYPGRLNCGILLGESPWCWNNENSVHSAQAVCERRAWTLARPGVFNVPDDLPAAALSHFWWPQDYVGRGALAIVWKDGRLVAQVLGMCRTTGDDVEPGEWTEIDLTDLGADADPERTPTLTEHLEQCGGCGVKAGKPHGEHCDHARCLVTGGQRAMCQVFGDAPTAGMETLTTGGSQAEFETYFRNDADHDCGQDVFRG